MIKVKLDEVLPGMVISENVFDPQTKKLLIKFGTKLTKDIITSLKTHNILDLPIEEEYTFSMNPEEMMGKELKSMLNQEIARLVPDKPEANPTDKVTYAAKRVLGILNQIKLQKNEDIVNFCLQMKICNSELLFKHCVTTCALSALVAATMDLSNEEIIQIGQAALLHDLGLCEMPFLVEKLKRNSQEEALWQEHTKYGYYLVKDANIDRKVGTLILHHHEQWNGSGFPTKVAGENIPLGSRIISVCETYDRLLRYENYPHYQAIEYLYGAGNYLFDSKVVNTFTNNLAVYPLGSLVRLSNGEVGLVVNVRKNLGPRPIVKVYFNSSNRPLSSPKDVDLGKERTIFIQKVL